MEKMSSCPICKNEILNEFIKCKDNTVSNEVYTIVECKGCNFKFTNPRPAANEIGKYYESENYISHSNSNKGIFNKLYQLIRNYTISRKKSLIRRFVSRGTLLDIGCGTGEFLNHMRSKNWEVKGIEPGDSARKFAVSNYNLEVKPEASLSEIANNSFDVITLWHVLEHVHELDKRVKELNRIIKPDGVVFIAVPNCTSYDAIYYEEFWAAYDVPRHLYHFTPKTISKLFAQYGFNLIETQPMKFDSFYVSMLSEKYKNGKINYFRALLSGLNSNYSARKNKDNSYSSQIYIFKKDNG